MSYGASVNWLIPEDLSYNLTDVRATLLKGSYTRLDGVAREEGGPL